MDFLQLTEMGMNRGHRSDDAEVLSPRVFPLFEMFSVDYV